MRQVDLDFGRGIEPADRLRDGLDAASAGDAVNRHDQLLPFVLHRPAPFASSAISGENRRDARSGVEKAETSAPARARALRQPIPSATTIPVRVIRRLNGAEPAGAAYGQDDGQWPPACGLGGRDLD